MIELSINGYFHMTIQTLDGFHVSDGVAQEVLEHLKSGQYVIGIESRDIRNLDNLQEPLYRFSLMATDSSEYDFESSK